MGAGASPSTVRRPFSTQTTPELQSLQRRLHMALLHAACLLCLEKDADTWLLTSRPVSLGYGAILVPSSVARHPEDSRQAMSKWSVNMVRMESLIQMPQPHHLATPTTLDNTSLGPYHVTPSQRCSTFALDARVGVQPAILPSFPDHTIVEDGKTGENIVETRQPCRRHNHTILCKISTMCRPLDQSGPRINMNPFPALTQFQANPTGALGI